MAKYIGQKEVFGAGNLFGIFGLVSVVMVLKNLITFFLRHNYARIL